MRSPRRISEYILRISDMLFGKKLKIFKKHDKDAEKKLREDIEAEGGLEKKDIPAMMISAFLVIFPVAIVGLAIVILLSLFFFGFF